MTTKTKSPPADRNSALTLGAVAAAGAVAGFAANFVRKAVVQAPTYLSGSWDEALATEHKMTLAIFDKIEATDETQVAKRGFLLMQLKHALAKHALQEENAVYAALRDAGDRETADALNNDHGYVKQYLYDLDMLPRSDAAWLPKAREFRHLIERHAGQEENEVFPRLRSKLTEEQNKTLTAVMNKEGLKIA